MTTTSIAPDAPVIARAETEVPAPPERVFTLISDIAAWPTWNPDVRAASIEGPLVAGTHFRWKAGPSTISSRLEVVEPPRRIVWTGTTLGIRAVHAYELTARGGRTLVVTEESWDGLLARLLRARLGQVLQRSLESGLRHLQEAAGR